MSWDTKIWHKNLNCLSKYLPLCSIINLHLFYLRCTSCGAYYITHSVWNPCYHNHMVLSNKYKIISSIFPDNILIDCPSTNNIPPPQDGFLHLSFQLVYTQQDHHYQRTWHNSQPAKLIQKSLNGFALLDVTFHVDYATLDDKIKLSIGSCCTLLGACCRLWLEHLITFILIPVLLHTYIQCFSIFICSQWSNGCNPNLIDTHSHSHSGSCQSLEILLVSHLERAAGYD